MLDTTLLIDGTARSTTHTFERRNPITEMVVTRAAAASVADANAAAAAAGAAFPSWSRTGPNARRALIEKAVEIMKRRADELVAVNMAETGAAGAWAHFDIHLAESVMREAAAATTHINGEVLATDRPGALSLAVREPMGVALGIAPWNAPVILGTRSIIWALACGNTTVLKASEMCPGTHRLLGEILNEAGFPHGTVNVITNAPADAAQIVQALIAHPAVRHINFTGSSRIGRVIAQEAAKHLKPVILELGGKSPLLVLDDADLDAAVNAAIFGAFMHQGQICMSTERVIVDRRVADVFAEKFGAKASTLAAGDPRTSNAPLGSLISNQAADRIEELIADAIAKGAKRLSGGHRSGTVMDATVLDHVTPAMRIYGEESFGPVTCMLRAENDDDAVKIANDSEYGLSAAIYSRNIGRALALARRIESGNCHINGPTVADEGTAPFGGMKASGYGKFGAKSGLDAFTNVRWITIGTEQPHYPF